MECQLMDRFIRFFLISVIFIFFSSCTKEEAYKPTLNQYVKDADLMVNVCKKFSNERDPVILRRTVLAMQSARTMACQNYNGECDLYNEFQVLALSLTKDGNFTFGSQAKLRAKLNELINAVDEGKKKLQLLK